MNTIILIILTLIGILFFVFLCIYLYARNQYKFWEKRSIPHSKPKFPTGTFDFGGKKHLAEIFNERYVKRGQNEFLGGFIMFHPTIEVYDVQLAKDIMGKDFNYFTNRGSYVNTRDDPLTGHLFNLEGDQWKVMREKLTHVFTSGKMKLMFELVKNIGEEFVKAIERELKFGNSIDVKEFCARYTTDVIGQCAFGIECNSLVNPDAEFRVIGRKVFKINKFKQLFTFNFQGLARKLKMQLFAKDVINFFVNAIHDLVDYREREKIERFDLIGFMMQKRNKEKTDDASDEMMPGLSMKELVAQAFVFYLAGFETSSTNMSYTLYELALNPEVQEKARKHVFQTIKKHGNSLTYDAIQEMHYLEACINDVNLIFVSRITT
uniref:CSON008156 protein n=1 Tax=Culicoides sonorensis TaxID=179676 RepID=A0A336LBG7_CULSO